MKASQWIQTAALAATLVALPLQLRAVAAQPAPAQAQAAQSPSRAGAVATADPAQGKTVFEVNCARCHGMDGSGLDGPDIRNVTSAMGDQAVLRTIRGGVPGTGMPGFADINEAGLGSLVAYIHNLGGVSDVQAAGNTANGKALFASKGCAGCHMVHGEGGDLGPDLSRIGAMRGAQGLREAIVNPGANLPQEGNVMDRGRFTQYLMFRAVTKDGQAVEGMRTGESTFAIVLRDAGGKFRSFEKQDLRSLESEPGKSLMPSFKSSLSDSELTDIVAYLSSLRGRE